MQNIGEFIHDVGIGVLITHCPGGKLAAWPLRVVAEGREVWRNTGSNDGKSLPLNVRFIVQPEPDVIRQVTHCPRVSATFQDGHRYCFLSGLGRIAQAPATVSLETVSLEMEVLVAEYRESAGAGDLWGRSLDATRRA
jgi:hypothetical protein